MLKVEASMLACKIGNETRINFLYMKQNTMKMNLCHLLYLLMFPSASFLPTDCPLIDVLIYLYSPPEESVFSH